MSVSYLRTRNRRPWGAEPNLAPPEFVPRTEREEARRAARDWLRERDETNVDEFEDAPFCASCGQYRGACQGC